MINRNEKSSGPKPRPYYDNLNYFGKDKWLHVWFAEKRTKLISVVFPPFLRWGLAPDTISYIGIAMLAGVALYFVRRPLLAVLFLAAHVICDGIDGAFARHTGKASQSGAFTDLVCDQLGMVIVSLLAIFHHMVNPVLGAAYMTLYLIVVVFGVIINTMGLGARITVTSKYFLYLVYLAWAIWSVNFIPALMYFFSIVMAFEVAVGYFRLKRGIRRKFDAEVRFTSGDPYSGKLNYVLNLTVPIVIFSIILVTGNWTPIRSMLDLPKTKVSWAIGPQIALENESIWGWGTADGDIFVLAANEDNDLNLRRFSYEPVKELQSFGFPEYVSPMFNSFPVQDGVLFVADSTTRLLLGFDLKASFASGKAVIVLTLPLEYLRITAMTVGKLDNRPVWFAANYLYTRKTYIVDPSASSKKGKLLAGVIGQYLNAGFPSGMTINNGYLVEYNKSPVQALLYAAPIKRLESGAPLMKSATTSFRPPAPDALGPLTFNGNLIMMTPAGQIYILNFKSILKY